MDHQILIALDPLPGERLEDAAEALLDGFTQAHPEAGAVTSADLEAGTFDVLISLDAASVEEAFERARPVIAAGLKASMLPPRPLASIHVRDAEHDSQGLVPA